MRGGTGSRNATTAIIKTLSDLVGGKGRARKGAPSTGTNRRVDVVSESLCDDVINYLAPTLEQHKGCSLVDIHPGPCLFSSKIHEFLKPQVHVLVEPDERYLEPFIKPLLDQHGSNYRHIVPLGKSPTAQWSNVRKMEMTGTLVPDKIPLTRIQPGKRQFDPSVLVIGNLARRRQGRIFDTTVELVPLVMHQMCMDLLGGEAFQANALTRMLWWLPEMYKPTIVPPNVPFNRSNFNVAVDMCFNTSEVAGVTPILSLMDTRRTEWVPRKRLAVYDQENARAVAESTKQLGMKAPKNRPVQDIRIECKRPGRNVESLSPLRSTANDATALQAMIGRLQCRITDNSTWLERVRVHYKRDKAMIRAAMQSLEYPQCRANHPTPPEDKRQTSEERVAVLFDLCLRLINIEANFKSLEESGLAKDVRDDLQDQILLLDDQINGIIENTSTKTKDFVEHLLEDQLAFHAASTLMAWDHRSYEPLQAQASDFWPNSEMTLLDFMPKNVDLAVQDLTDGREATRFCVELLKNLFSNKYIPLPVALDRVGINASKDLIPMVPAITDARKGGRLNPKNLRVQMLTTEMIEGLVKAFFEWPFRPEKWELTLSRGDEKSSTRVSDTGKIAPID